MENSNLKNGKWDITYSSYYWNIHLNLDHPQNSVPILTGYSKRVGENENQDKDLLLKRKIINLFLNSYFKRMRRIEIFMRADSIIDKKRDPKILVLYPKHYDIPELNHDVIFRKFGVFLKEFYDRVDKVQGMADLLPPSSRKLSSLDDLLNVHTFKPRSLAHLYSKAAALLTHGHEPGAVSAYILRIKEINNL